MVVAVMNEVMIDVMMLDSVVDELCLQAVITLT